MFSVATIKFWPLSCGGNTFETCCMKIFGLLNRKYVNFFRITINLETIRGITLMIYILKDILWNDLDNVKPMN